MCTDPGYFEFDDVFYNEYGFGGNVTLITVQSRLGFVNRSAIIECLLQKMRRY